MHDDPTQLPNDGSASESTGDEASPSGLEATVAATPVGQPSGLEATVAAGQPSGLEATVAAGQPSGLEATVASKPAGLSGLEATAASPRARRPSGLEATQPARPVPAPLGNDPTAADHTLPAAPPVDPDHLRRGAEIGRYVVLGRLGAGGMGVVYAAHDPELDRKVALKLMLPGLGGTQGSARMLREAQALAKLQHPNVVAIHDVGTHRDRVWMAMEFIEGVTLGAWRKERSRSWREIIDLFAQVARGLGGAHAAGLLHRDIKPDNIMVGNDARARVMDFGLARTSEAITEATTRPGRPGGSRPKVEALALRLTQAGSLLGTPAYMSPEQLRGEEVGAASDQFSLCVTLWEALYGVRPFAGDSMAELSDNVLHGRITPPPRVPVPSWLRKVIQRGLAVDPAARYSSVEALREALARGRIRARVRRGLGVAAVLAVAGVGVFGFQRLAHSRAVAACESAGSAIEDSWNQSARERIRAALLATQMSYADETVARVLPWLDDKAAAWRRARTEVCLDSTVRGTWDDDLEQRGLFCLDELQLELDALATELARGESTSVEKAVFAAAALGDPAGCHDRDLLRRRPVPPRGRHDDVRLVMAQLSRATALERTGAFDQGLEVAVGALARAEALDWPPLVAGARYRIGILRNLSGDADTAASDLEAAYFDAARAGAAEMTAAAASALIQVEVRRAHHDQGQLWARHAEVALAALGDTAGVPKATYLSALAGLHVSTGEYEQAIDLYQKTLAIRREVLGPEHPEVGWTLNGMARATGSAGKHDQAVALYRQALAIWQTTVGPGHPAVATGLNNLGIEHYDTGEYDQARELYERAIAIRERALGPTNRDTAQSINNLANVHWSTGELDEALALYRRALSLREQSLGPEHPDVAQSLNNLALVHADRGEHDEAAALHQRALAIKDKALGAEHPSVAVSLHNLADVELARGAIDQARANWTRALAIWEKALGAEHPNLGYGLVGLAKAELAARRTDESVVLAERAVSLFESTKVPAAQLAEARFVLAQALWNKKSDRPRAIALAGQALSATGTETDAASQKKAKEIADWLAAHRSTLAP